MVKSNSLGLTGRQLINTLMNNIKSAIILAGGLGKRMKSDLPKVLHTIDGKAMIFYTIEHLEDAGFNEIVVLVCHKKEEIMEALGSRVKYAVQESPLGTGDAAYQGLKGLGKDAKNVLVVNGDDSAFYNSETLSNIYSEHLETESVVSFATAVLKDPFGIGRVVRDENGNLIKIIEEKEASEEQKMIKEANIGLYVFNVEWLKSNEPNLRKSDSGEYYIVDLIEMALSQNKKVNIFQVPETEWHGVNTLDHLLEANKKMQERKNKVELK
jgi:bifunctional UDP-N-acetylglucosamine pyrophosphorylase/glucosamine-1-phosphate N-acetyltransferase